MLLAKKKISGINVTEIQCNKIKNSYSYLKFHMSGNQKKDTTKEHLGLRENQIEKLLKI